jgi:uncharacterized protein YutE (UPF0331/DUF86 family)
MGLDVASPISVIYSLAASGLIGQDISDLYDALRDARNLLSHAQVSPDRREANEYMRQANFLLAMLKILKGKIDRGEIKV